MNIQEDYVSFEIANLLKEKGFDEPCHAYYEDNGTFRESYSACAIRNITNPCFFGIASPTLQMAMKWLRKVHNLYTNIWADPKDAENNDFNTIFRAQVYNGNSNYGTSEYSTYEDAAEAAIKYCLENLI